MLCLSRCVRFTTSSGKGLRANRTNDAGRPCVGVKLISNGRTTSNTALQIRQASVLVRPNFGGSSQAPLPQTSDKLFRPFRLGYTTPGSDFGHWALDFGLRIRVHPCGSVVKSPAKIKLPFVISRFTDEFSTLSPSLPPTRKERTHFDLAAIARAPFSNSPLA